MLLPVGAILCSILALNVPSLFVQLKSGIVPLLMLIMFCMGLTLTPAAFGEVMKRPKVLLLGMAAQFGVMPFAAWGLSRLLGLPDELAVGLILVGACPGGTASNVICFLARCNSALSVCLTACSTLVAVVLTPWLTLLYAGQRVPVPVGSMLLGVAKIVLLPVLLGLVVKGLWKSSRIDFSRICPPVSVAAIVLIIAIVVALNKSQLSNLGLSVGLAVVLHNLTGLLAGYGLARLFGYDTETCRTLSIEVGMQNSGLGVALAVQYFGGLAALPGALFSVWHNLSGSAVAAWWSGKGLEPTKGPEISKQPERSPQHTQP
jgi:BASS family bile acid:Na+ symporter